MNDVELAGRCFWLIEGAVIYQIAKNCRKSVEMIEKHYTAHIKTALDTVAINVRREPPRPAKEMEKQTWRGKSDHAEDEMRASSG